MIKHIVCFKLKDASEESCLKTAQILKSMQGNVPQINTIEVGVDFLHSERSYDVILQVTVDDEKALNDYQNDPYHCDVVKKYIHSVRESSVAVDYYLD